MSEPNVNAIPTTRATHHSRTHKLTVCVLIGCFYFRFGGGGSQIRSLCPG